MIKLKPEDQDFIKALAVTDTGTKLVRYLENIEVHYADIRNLDGVDAGTRIDALKLLREALLDKLLVLSGKQELPDNDEFR